MTTLILPRPSQHAPDLTPDEARALTDRIRATVADLLPLIKEAFDRRADVALGYANWLDYCDTELRGLRLPVSQRREAAAELRETGMSTRAIAGALGVTQPTVVNDLRAGDKDLSPDSVTGLDGKTYAASRPPSTKNTTDSPADPVVSADGRVSDAAGSPDRPGPHTEGDTRPEPERPKPPAWDPEERRQHEEEVRRIQDIEAARRTATTIVTEVRSLVVTIVAGSRLGEKGLVTAEMIADLRKAIDLLEGEL